MCMYAHLVIEPRLIRVLSSEETAMRASSVVAPAIIDHNNVAIRGVAAERDVSSQ